MSGDSVKQMNSLDHHLSLTLVAGVAVQKFHASETLSSNSTLRQRKQLVQGYGILCKTVPSISQRLYTSNNPFKPHFRPMLKAPGSTPKTVTFMEVPDIASIKISTRNKTSATST
jgi:hypothetical protein